MKKIITIAAALLLLASCGGGYNPPDRPTTNPNTGGNSGTSTTPTASPVASFSYKTSHPFYVHFTNTSKDATYYSWDFGDGTTSSEKNPIHKYSGKGVYKVVLTAKGNGKTDTYTKNITIVAPTKCYVTGIIYEKIPKNNEYYSIRCTDDYILFETCYWYTDWLLLSSANVPYTQMFKYKQEVDFSKSKVVTRLYQSSNSSGSGRQVESWNLYPSKVLSEYWEATKATSDNAEIRLLFEWQD